MKKRIKKRLSFLLLTLLGFSTACEKQKNGEPPPVMYGTPHVDIWVGGKVTTNNRQNRRPDTRDRGTPTKQPL